MKARVKWVEKRTFLGESGTGHGVVLGNTRGDASKRVASKDGGATLPSAKPPL